MFYTNNYSKPLRNEFIWLVLTLSISYDSKETQRKSPYYIYFIFVKYLEIQTKIKSANVKIRKEKCLIPQFEFIFYVFVFECDDMSLFALLIHIVCMKIRSELVALVSLHVK